MDKRANFERLRCKLKSELFTQDTNQNTLSDQGIIPQNPQVLDYFQSCSDSNFTEECSFVGLKKALTPSSQFKEQYQVGKILGEGAHAVVRQCWPIDTPDDTYAVKITRSADPEIMDIMKQTFYNTITLNHPSICKSYRLFIDQNMEEACLVMEYLPYPSLLELIKEKKKLDLLEAQIIVRQILDAVLYIHSMGICHRDIKPDNIVVDQDNDLVKLIDFGVSKRFFTSSHQKDITLQLMWTVTGNMRYQAPELWYGTGYTQSIDIWAVGVVAYQMLCGTLPIDQQAQMEYFENDHEYTKHFEDPNFISLPPIIKDFLRRLLKWDHSVRLTAKQCLMHPWLYIEKVIPQQIRQKRYYYLSQDDIVTSVGIRLTKTKLNKSMTNVIQYKSNKQPQINQEVLRSTIKMSQFIKRCFLDTLHCAQRETSQQMYEKSIRFEQSIKFDQSVKASILLEQQQQQFTTNKVDMGEFFDVIKACESNSSFDEEKETKIGIKSSHSKLNVIVEENENQKRNWKK